MKISADFPALLYVVILVVVFVVLWGVKRWSQMKQSGVDPMVMGRSSDPLQRYFEQMTVFLGGLFIVLLVLHALGLRDVWGFERLHALERAGVNEAGLVVGLLGLGLCRVAQVTMGRSWRMGIDEAARTDLVDTGVFRYIRNPTYAGLFLMVLGVWLIWPTPFITIFGLLFVLLMEVQVRAEEQFLARLHGEKFTAYAARTKRYVPWLY